MGSFANSLHLKCEDADQVGRAVHEIMEEAGYRTTDEEPDEEAVWGVSSPLRAIRVTEPHDGWLAVLDSDFMGCEALAEGLSRRLGTYAIQFMVSDSDFWCYRLLGNGQLLDEFESSAGTDDEFEAKVDPSEITHRMTCGDVVAMQERAQALMEELQRKTEADMPADVRSIRERMSRGAATPEEMRCYTEWMQPLLGDMAQQVNEAFSGLGASPDPSPAAKPEPALADHVDRLRPILLPSTSPDRIVRVLAKQTVFAEETLADFMKLVGVQPLYANLSYGYFGEYPSAELAAEGVRGAAHLKFRR